MIVIGADTPMHSHTTINPRVWAGVAAQAATVLAAGARLRRRLRDRNRVGGRLRATIG